MSNNQSSSGDDANVRRSQLSSQAFDLFVGFVYAMTIALVIETAYLRTHFNSLAPAGITLGLLTFFAYDWHSRYSPRRAMVDKMSETRFLLLLRRFLEISIVYSLLLFCLKFIELKSPKTIYKEDIVIDESLILVGLLYSVCVFALTSGAWNFLMIRDYKKIDWNPHIANFFKGSLHTDIVAQFPVIAECMAELDNIHKDADTAAQEEVMKFTETSYVDRQGNNNGRAAKLEQGLKRLRWHHWRMKLRQILVRSPNFIFPYLFVLHVVVLNIVLGVFILVCAVRGDYESLFGSLPSVWAGTLCCAVLGAVVSFAAFLGYFMSGREKAWCERLGCFSLMVTILLLYSVCSSTVLIGLVAIQQVAANIIMTQYFEPSTSPPVNGAAQRS